VGHAGTLDPFATGLLIVLLGQATRLSEYLLGLPKVYEASARLGVETTTDDTEGDVVAETHAWDEVTRESAEAVLASFSGDHLQEPPVYSAKKVKGEAAHRRVRRGEDVSLEKAWVTIYEIALTAFALPEVGFRVRCSAGTYVRALGRDLGRSLGVGAHLKTLRRTGIGGFSVEAALSLPTLESGEGLEEHLISPAAALSHLRVVTVSQADAVRIRQGQFLPLEGQDLPEGEPVRILLEGDLLAIGARTGDHLRPRKVLGV